MSGVELSVGVRPYSGGRLVGQRPVSGFSCRAPGDPGRRADPGAESEGRQGKAGPTGGSGTAFAWAAA